MNTTTMQLCAECSTIYMPSTLDTLPSIAVKLQWRWPHKWGGIRGRREPGPLENCWPSQKSPAF